MRSLSTVTENVQQLRHQPGIYNPQNVLILKNHKLDYYIGLVEIRLRHQQRYQCQGYRPHQFPGLRYSPPRVRVVIGTSSRLGRR